MSEAEFKSRLGPYSKLPSELGGHDALYLPKADMTMLVNVGKQEVTVWRIGKAAK